MKLTIAIPTYNRPRQLLNTLTKLLPQLTADCFLLILDNHSDTPVSDFTQDIFKQYPQVHYKILINNVNIGGDSNIIRCFEFCKTKWLWTLGDDDLILTNVIATLFDDMELYPDVLNINYSSPSNNRPSRKETLISTGREEFLRNIDSFGTMMYISCNLYNVSLMQGSHWLANTNTYSLISQWLIVFYSVKADTRTVLSSKVICTNPFVTDGTEDIGLRLVQGLSTLFDMRISVIERKLLINALYKDMNNLVPAKSMLRIMSIQYRINKKGNLKFLFKRTYYTFYRHFQFKVRFEFFLYYTIFSIAPNLCYRTIRKMYLKKRNIDLDNIIR